MANYSGVPHRGIPFEEFIVKEDGQSYYPFTGILNHIREDVEYHKHEKWGFLIYRCDYASDETWAKFLSHLNLRMEEELEIHKAEDLQATLAMTPIEDKQTLDGATVGQVRAIFTDWVRSDEAKAEINGDPRGAWTYPRQTYCVHVDADVLDSVVNRAPQPPVWDEREIAYANLVQLRHEDFPERFSLPVEETAIDDNMDEESVEEEEEEEDSDMDESEYGDEHFVKVPVSYLGPESYNNLYTHFTFERFVQYRRSDDVSFGGGALNPEDFYGPLDS
jgi:hypothetical protein